MNALVSVFHFHQEDGKLAQELGRVFHHVDQNVETSVAVLLSLENGLTIPVR